MSLLLTPPQTAPPPPKQRGRWGVHKLVYLVPKQQQHDLEWWIAHLRKHWEP